MPLDEWSNTPVSGPDGPLTRRYAPAAAMPCRDHSEGAQIVLCTLYVRMVWQEGGMNYRSLTSSGNLNKETTSLLSRTEKPRAILRGRIASLPCACCVLPSCSTSFNIDEDRLRRASQNRFQVSFTDLLQSTRFAFFALILPLVRL